MRPDRKHNSLDVQRAACLGLLVASQKMTEAYLRLLEEQQKTLASVSRKRRLEDRGAAPSVAGSAADLQYCYGRRCHDVDVERL
jgi:hypothetical protein